MNRSPLRHASPNLAATLACFALCLSSVRAVTPAPDGGYSGANTAEGTNSLFSLTDGVDNTAIGFQTLFKDTSGFGNTAIGYVALGNNTTGFDNTATNPNDVPAA